MNGGNELRFDMIRKVLQQLPNVGADAGTPRLKRQGVEAESRNQGQFAMGLEWSGLLSRYSYELLLLRHPHPRLGRRS